MPIKLLLLSLLIFGTVALADVLETTGQQVNVAPITLRFCYEDKQLLPYYAGDGAVVPEQPGATIEHLRRATAQVGIELELIRLPWLRCLQQLEDNSIDALVAAFDTTREHYTVYPKQPDGTPDTAKAINQLSLCLAYRYDNPLIKKLQQQHAITLSRPLGYRPIPFPPQTTLVAAHSPEHALDLVISGRVDATTVLCELNGIRAKEQHLEQLPVLLLYPALYKSDGYLMLSNGFYQRDPELAERLWQALPATRDKERYLHYLTYP
ncbi:amino acid ABC transporter [Rheinheimera sp.]|uniref:amino acid ABC transporter n=1 Tax=Rheinheimera sp. TaxID=1869214 RepID=UPI0040481DAF